MEMLKDFNISSFKKIKPPSDSSFDTSQEIKELKKIPLNKKFVKDYDNRPRPKKLDKKLVNYEMDSMKTPSYPSGHSVQGTLIANTLADKYPKSKTAFLKTGQNISYSRNVARAHYKSDSKFGDKIGVQMYKHLKNA